MFVAASSRCFSDKSFSEACYLLDDLGYDKLEIWFDERTDHLKTSTVVADPDRFYARYRESTRLTPISFCLETDVSLEDFRVLSRLAKQFRIAQITVPPSPLGTPFNAEIERLRDLFRIASEDGVLVSIKTKTGTLTEDPNNAVELCQSTNGLGLTLDPSYYTCGREQPYDHVFSYVYHVHLRDTSPEQLQVPIGLGVIDYSRLISQLERVKYNRALCVELLPELMELDTRPIELRKMRLLLESQL